MKLFQKTKKNGAQKIFCIGLSGTATRSLNEAFKMLGYNSKHYPRSLEDFQNYDVLLDIPVSCRYRELDVLFPGSLFILTTREMDSWLDNRSRKPEDLHEKSLWVRETRLRTYGVPKFEREHYIKLYKKFHDGVDAYFSSRPQSLLKMNIIGGDGWHVLCSFLNISNIPGQPFPVVRNAHSPKRRNEWRIHIGAHKTATTHVQDTLAAVRKELRSCGMEYVPRKEVRGYGGIGRSRWWHPILNNTQANHWMYKSEQNNHCLLFSEERILGRVSHLLKNPLYPDLEKNLREIKRMGKNRDVVLFMSIRSFDTILPSAYAQQVRMGKAGRVDFDAIKKQALKSPPQWSIIVERILKLFDVDQLKIWRYEDYKNDSFRFLSNLCSGVLSYFPEIPPPPSTKSPSAEKIRLLEDICPTLPRGDRSAEADRVCSLDSHGETRYQPFSNEETELLKSNYMEDVSFIDQRYPDMILR